MLSSANGWSYGKMSWDATLKAYCYVIMMGEALREQFQISCDGRLGLLLLTFRGLRGFWEEQSLRFMLEKSEDLGCQGSTISRSSPRRSWLTRR